MASPKRIARRTAEGLGLAVVFAGAAAVAAVASLDLPPARRYVASTTNRILGSTFEGAIALEDVKQLSIGKTTRLRVGTIVISDPEKKPVLVAHDADVTIDLAKLVASLRAGGPPEVALEKVTVGAVDVTLDANEKGELGIARAFAAKKDPHAPPPPPPPPPPDPNAESIRLAIPSVTIGKAHIHGNVAPPRLDANADAVTARVAIDKNVLAIDADHATATFVEPLAPNVNGPIRAEAKGGLRLHLGSGKMTANGTLDGDANGVRFTAQGGIDDGVIDATVDVPRTEAAAIVKVVPAAPLAQPAALHAKAHGKPSDLALDVRADVGDGVVTAKGSLGLEGAKPFRMDVDATKLDVRGVGGPKSDINATIHAEGTLDKAPAGTFEIKTRPSNVADQPLPILVVAGTMKGDAIHADIQADDPGVAAKGTADVDLAKKTVAYDLHARANDLASVGRARGVVSGSATVHAKGEVDYGRGTMTGSATAELANVSKENLAVKRAHVEATLDGPLAAPSIAVTANATDVTMTSDGKEPLVYPSAVARARIAIAPSPRITGSEVKLATKDGAEVVARADEITVANGFAVRGASVTGLGAPVELRAEMAGDRLVIRAKGDDLDLEKAAKMTGIKELTLLPKGSRARVDMDLTSDAIRADGHVDIVVDAKEGNGGELHAKLDGRKIDLRGRVNAGSVGWVEVSRAELELPGPPNAKTLPRATGVVEIRGAIDLGMGAAMFGGDAMERVERIDGIATFEARAERGDASRMPSVRATVKTSGLDVAIAAPDHKGPSAEYHGVDVEAHVAHDAATDDTEIALLAWDDKGALASANMKSRVPLVTWVRTGKKIDADAFASLDLAGAVDIAQRNVGELPSFLGAKGIAGELGGHVDVAGTLASPSVTVRVRGDGLAATKTPTKEQERSRGGSFAPVDLGVDAKWDGENAVVSVWADEREKKKDRPSTKAPGHVRLLAIGRARAKELLAGTPIDWDASAELDVTDLELGPMPLPFNLRGALTGRVGLAHLATKPKLTVDAHVDDLTMGGVRINEGKLALRARDGSLDGRVSLVQDDGGRASVKLTSKGLHWKGADVDLDRTKDSHVEYVVSGLRLGMLAPVVRKFAPEIDGRIDGKGSATIGEKEQTFEGGITLSEGRLYVNALGEEVSDFGGTLRFDRSGAFRLDDMKGKVGAGFVTASASGKMKGLTFEEAKAVIVIPDKGGGIPLSSEGATFANASGELRITANLQPNDDRLIVVVDVPRAPISLPDRNTQSLQAMDKDPTIAVGIRDKEGTLVPVKTGRRRDAPKDDKGEKNAETAASTELTVKLGREVEVKGRGLQVFLGGKVVVLVSDEVAVRGQIDLRGGSVSVQGRRFVIDHGTISFTEHGQADNPTIIASAHWDAPDRTRVIVEFSGPVKTGKVVLRSEPAYSKSEILSILLFGRPDPNVSKGGNALGAGLGASGLNSALGELDENLGVESDTTGESRTRTKLRYQIRRNLAVHVAYAGTPSPREPDTTYLDFEWLFIPQFSLVGTRGDTGTSILDLIFEHRY